MNSNTGAPTMKKVELNFKELKTALKEKDKAVLKQYTKIITKARNKRKRENGELQQKAKTPKRKPTAWDLHVADVRKKNPGLAFKAVLQKAKESYVKVKKE